MRDVSAGPVHLERRSFENWSRMIRVDDVLTATPKTEDEALSIVQWAAGQGYRVRPVGSFLGWSPLAFVDAANIIAIDQSQMTGLTGFTYEPVPAATFRAGTTLAEAVKALEEIDNRGESEAPGWAWPDYPGIPAVTLGGMLAIGAHGAGIRQRDDQADLFGTVSNLVLGFRAIVSDGDCTSFGSFVGTSLMLRPCSSSWGLPTYCLSPCAWSPIALSAARSNIQTGRLPTHPRRRKGAFKHS